MIEEKNMDYTEKLIKESIKNNEESFSILIHSIESEMYKIAKIKLENQDDIYEAIQETIILIYKNLKKLKDFSLFRTWSMRILINECNKIFKRNKKYNEKNIEFDENLNLKYEEYESFEKVEENQNMNKLLNSLNDSEKIVITLYYADNFTTKEIADIVAEPEGTVKSKISRAKLKIRKLIEEESLYE